MAHLCPLRRPLVPVLLCLVAACGGEVPAFVHCDPASDSSCQPTVLPLDAATLGEHRVEIPGLPPGSVAYNAGLLRRGDGFLLAFRLDAPAPELDPKTAQIGVVELDGRLQPRGPYTLLDTAWPGDTRPTAEDPRLVELNGEAYVVYNSKHEGHGVSRRLIHVGRLVELAGRPRAYALVDAKQVLFAPDGHLRAVEKNWTPFAHAGELHLLYAHNPPRALAVSAADLAGDATQVWAREVSRGRRRVAWPHGPIRGGTQAIYDPALDAYVALFHSRSVCAELRPGGPSPYYMMGLYALSPRPPFEIAAMVPLPLLHDAFYRAPGAYQQIVFPEGLAVDDDALHISYGQDDQSIHVISLDKQAIYAALRAPPG